MSETGKLAARFKKWRKKKGFTLRDLEASTGLSNAFLSQFENGKSNISYENAKLLIRLMRTNK